MLRIRLFTFLLIFTVLVSLALHTFPARAQPSYTPGVRPGDYVTYGEFSQNGTCSTRLPSQKTSARSNSKSRVSTVPPTLSTQHSSSPTRTGHSPASHFLGIRRLARETYSHI